MSRFFGETGKRQPGGSAILKTVKIMTRFQNGGKENDLNG